MIGQFAVACWGAVFDVDELLEARCVVGVMKCTHFLSARCFNWNVVSKSFEIKTNLNKNLLQFKLVTRDFKAVISPAVQQLCATLKTTTALNDDFRTGCEIKLDFGLSGLISGMQSEGRPLWTPRGPPAKPSDVLISVSSSVAVAERTPVWSPPRSSS